MMTSTKSILVPSWLLVIGIIVAYLWSAVAAGHGVGFVGLLLVVGWEYWFTPVSLGWIGIVLLIGGKLFDRLEFVLHFGVAFIVVSWAIFLWHSDILMNIITSIPFYFCLKHYWDIHLKAWRAI